MHKIIAICKNSKDLYKNIKMDKDKQYIRDPFYFNIYTNEKVEYTKGDIIKIQVMTM